MSGSGQRIFTSAGVVQEPAIFGRVLARAGARDAFHLAGATGDLPLILT